MTHTPAQIVRALMTEGAGAGFTKHVTGQPDGLWPMYVSVLPETPNEVAAVFDREGEMHSRLLASGAEVESPGVQIKVRGSNYQETYKRLSDEMERLSRVRHLAVTIDSETYVVDTVRRTSSVLPLGQDAARRASFSVNILLMFVE